MFRYGKWRLRRELYLTRVRGKYRDLLQAPRAYGAFEYSLRTDSDLGSDATPPLQAFYYFARSLEENMDATRKAVVAVALAEDQALQNK